jgi:hypothetical protein
VGKINEASKKSSYKLLGGIWKYLNISSSSTREYILALIFFTRNLSYFKSVIDVSLANVEKWLENCSNIIYVNKDNDMAVLPSIAICSIIDYSIDNKLAIEIEGFLNGIYIFPSIIDMIQFVFL